MDTQISRYSPGEPLVLSPESPQPEGAGAGCSLATPGPGPGRAAAEGRHVNADPRAGGRGVGRGGGGAPGGAEPRVFDAGGVGVDPDGEIPRRGARVAGEGSGNGASTKLFTGRPVYNLHIVVSAAACGVRVCFRLQIETCEGKVYEVATGCLQPPLLHHPAVVRQEIY